MFTDLAGAELEAYASSQVAPEDFDDFWTTTLAEARAVASDVICEEVATPLKTVRVFDVRFSGFGGQRIAAWLRLPAGASGPLPTIVEFVGYGGGRGLAEENLFWASAGFAHLHMDTRGQGAMWSVGATPDDAPAGPRVPGMMTAGIEDPARYYYRRLITDAVRCLDAATTIPEIDAGRIAALGASQGGGVALAASALSPVPRALVSYVPFLCDFPRAITITDADPYREIGRYLATHRSAAEKVLSTLSYFDGVNFARRASIPAWFTTALMDAICPPSTVYGAYRAYAGPKEIHIWPYNGHEGGALADNIRIAQILSGGALA